MLSIGKVGGGQASPSYYVDTVAKGQDDYYTGAGEAPGQWAGKGAGDRGLTGTVEDDAFLATLTANPADGKTVLAYDLTFSAPKSVSVLYAVTDPSVSRLVRQAHDEAVVQALGYVEREAAWTRRGRGGQHHLRGDGLTIATFRHRTSRAGDPQLHTHSVVANSTVADGRATALDGRALYAHARTAGFLYQAVLRHELTRTVGVEFGAVTNGTAEIHGIDDQVIRHFSQRREDVLEHMRNHGGRSRRSAQIATLETRRAKTTDTPVGHLRDEWKARAAEHGLDADALADLLDRRAPGRPRTPDLAAAAEDLAAPGGVTQQASTFDRRDVLRDWAEAHPEGVTVERIEQLADRWMATAHAVRLEERQARAPYGGPKHSTPDMLAAEQRLLDQAADRRATGTATADVDALQRALVSQPGLAPEQAALVKGLTRSGDGIQVIRAAAGTGKTYALATARSAWEQSGVHVYGCALSARAAVELESLGGIDSSTIARLEQDVAHGHGLPRGSVLIVDEAAMVGTRALASLADHAAETESKLVLVGDDRQLPEIAAGGAFRGIADRCGALELRHVRRQEHVWDRDALNDLRHGRVRDWAEAYREHGRLVARPTASATRDALVDDWWEVARTNDTDAIMLAHRRVDVAELNARARARMHRDGRLSEQELVAGQRAYAIGDKVLARRNDRRLGLVNGTRAEVVGVKLDQGTLVLRTQTGEDREVSHAYLDEGWLEHGYALTAHAAQGATVEHAFVLGSDELYREWGYTAMSRHTVATTFYAVSPGSVERALPGLEPESDPLVDDVVATLRQSRRQELATDLAERNGGGPRSAISAQIGATTHHIAQDELAHTEARLHDLRAELDQTSSLRRGRRRELTTLIGQHAEQRDSWASDLASTREVCDAETDTQPPWLDVRTARSTLTAALAEHPLGLAAREDWCREAARLLASRPREGVFEPGPSDLGLEL